MFKPFSHENKNFKNFNASKLKVFADDNSDDSLNKPQMIKLVLKRRKRFGKRKKI